MDLVASLIGYLASVLLALSLMVTNDLKFRWLNSFGCLAFIVYGVMINAFPIILTNGILLLINVYRLIMIHRTKENFDMVAFEANDQMIDKFIKFYQKDIAAYFPSFTTIVPADDIRFVVLRNMVPANVFVASLSADGTATIKINYTIPRFRDYQVGRYIFEREKNFLQKKGVKRIVYDQPVKASHQQFLKVMGFTASETEGTTIFTKEL